VFVPDLREKSHRVAGGRPQSWLGERFVPPSATRERLDHDEGIEGAETKPVTSRADRGARLFSRHT